jgi:hypothetical protein
LVATRPTKAAITMRTTNERVPSAVVEHLPLVMPPKSLLRAGPAVVQTPAAATHPPLHTAQHRHYLPRSLFLLMPRVRTLDTLAHPIPRWASDQVRRQRRPCNSLRHPITHMQAQRNSTTPARTALRVMISMLPSRDSWHHPPPLVMVSANPANPPPLVNGHMVEEQSRVATHGGEQLYLHRNTYLYTRF